MAHFTLSTELAFGDAKDVVDDQFGDIDASRRNAVSKLHGVIHLVHLKSMFRFEDINCHDSAAHSFSGPDGKVFELTCQRTVKRLTALSGIGDPVIGNAIDRGNTFIADNEASDDAPLFFDVLLNIENRMVVAA